MLILKNIFNRFICELFKQGALPKKIILICITELSEKKDDLHMYCLCFMLKLVGHKLSEVNIKHYTCMMYRLQIKN